MASAKDIRVAPISCKAARQVVSKYHYSGKFDTRSKLHFGVFLNGRCGGAIQLGDPIDKRKALVAVGGTSWHSLLDLHRFAFADWLPRNSESRALGVMMRLIRQSYPHIEWIQSYADATQCGDGTIYRASGFDLIGIKRNNSMYILPNGQVVCKIVLEPGFRSGKGNGNLKAILGHTGSETSGVFLKRIGAQPLPGFQLRYIYFLNPAARERLTVPILPFSRIAEMGASMYRGERTRPKQATPATSGEAAGQNRPGRSNLPTAGTDEPA
jgi:hypothetical protein